ncbi:MAG: hypothetical protein IJ748_06830 [Bacteroidales bacterium]|nr:hypothetical protein [Bacteroidales bacterium]
MKIRILLLFLILSVACSYLRGQASGELSSTLKSDTNLQSIFYFHATKTDYVSDTLFRVNDDLSSLHYYDPMLNPQNSFWQYLSVMGTPSVNLIYSSPDILDYQRQANNYLPYIFSKENVKYFQNNKAYSAFSYNAGTDAQQYFDVIFARNVYKGLNLATEYKVNYADGNLNNSQVMNQFFNVALNYISPTGRYRNNASFIHSRAYILENGGILTDSMFINSEYSSMETYPTRLNAGWSKWKTNEFYFNQSFRLSQDTKKNYGALVHSVSWEKYARLYNDENKVFLDSLATTLQRNSLYWTNLVSSDILIPLHFGINADNISFRDSLQKKTFTNISPHIKAAYKNKISLSFIKTFSDNSYNNDYQFDAALNNLFIKKSYKDSSIVFDAYIKANIQNKRADYIFSHYFTENLSWDNKTGKTSSKSVTLGFRLKKLINVELSYFNIGNRYFFDSTLAMHKANTDLFQVNIKNKFNLKRFSFCGLLSLQKAENENAIHLPLLAFKESVYYNFFMMKGKLPAQIGIDLNYTTSYYADMYNPLTGMFVWQDKMKIGNHVYADFFFSMRVKSFSLFASLTHISSFLQSHDYFNTPLYPHNGFAFRYGISWRFTD